MPYLLYCSRSEEHTSELQSRLHLVCRLLLEKKYTLHPMFPTRFTPDSCRTEASPSPPAHLFDVGCGESVCSHLICVLSAIFMFFLRHAAPPETPPPSLQHPPPT